ncbi:SDR family NAD(P)-dependent oxidoreductase [Brevundimonas sp.]|uniref:SDR family NAD(P)-dependent oxidoreductase n=1 Tax=Brevundimonas sp. TaxID=1871086 RepID=UPI003514654F
MSDRVLVITGGQGQLGRAVITAALARGLKVAAIDHSAVDPFDSQACLEIGGVDLTDADAAKRAVDQAQAHFGRLDAALNIAGGFVWQTVDDAEPAWDRMHRLNLVTALNTSRAALPHLMASDEGRVVNVGAAGALKSGMGMGAYAASKSAVHRLTESLAEETKSSSVKVNAVLPSILDTPQNRKDMPDADPAAWVKVEDLAEVMLFLASPASRAMTGALVPVTGRV